MAAKLGKVPRDLLPWLRIGSFEPIQKPTEDDWPHGKGQTFEAFAALNIKGPQPRSKAYLLPIAERHDISSFPSMDALAQGCTAFYGLPCAVLPTTSLEQLESGTAARSIRTRHSDMNGTQVNASDILANLKRHLPSDGFTICGVTTSDLYSGDFNFLFGLAGLHAGEVSIHRLTPASPSCELFHDTCHDNPTRVVAAARGLCPAMEGDAHLLLRHTMQTLMHEMLGALQVLLMRDAGLQLARGSGTARPRPLPRLPPQIPLGLACGDRRPPARAL